VYFSAVDDPFGQFKWVVIVWKDGAEKQLALNQIRKFSVFEREKMMLVSGAGPFARYLFPDSKAATQTSKEISSWKILDSAKKERASRTEFYRMRIPPFSKASFPGQWNKAL
jgi:hypothetical protein